MQTSHNLNQHPQSYKKDPRFNSWNNTNDFRLFSGNSSTTGGRFPSHSTTISSKSTSSGFSYNNLPTFMKSSNLLKPSKSSISTSTGFRQRTGSSSSINSNSEALPFFMNRKPTYDLGGSTINPKLNKYGNLRIPSDDRSFFDNNRAKDPISTGNKLFRVFTSESNGGSTSVLQNNDGVAQQPGRIPSFNYLNYNNDDYNNDRYTEGSETILNSSGPGATTLGDHELDPEVEFLNFLKCIILIAFQLLKKGFLWGLIFLKVIASILVTYINNIPDVKGFFGVEGDIAEEVNNQPTELNKGEEKTKTLLSKLIPAGFSTPLTNSTKKVLEGFNAYNTTFDDTPSVPRKASSININPTEKINKLASRLQNEVKEDSKSIETVTKPTKDYGSHFFSTNKLDADAQLMKTAQDERFKSNNLMSDYETNRSNSLETYKNTLVLESIPSERLSRVKATLRNVLSKTKNDDEGLTQEEKVEKVIRNVNKIFDRKFNELRWTKNDKDDYVLHLDSTDLYKNYQKIMEERAKLKKLISLISGKKVKVSPLSFDQLNVVKSYFSSPMLQNKIIDAFNIPISIRDLQTLRDGRWLNDNIIDFYLSMIVDRSKQQQNSKLPKVFAFTTHFYSTLSTRGYQGVARWAKRAKVDVTTMDYVFVPVNLHESHWALSVINNKAKKFQYFDSLFGSGTHVLESLASYMVQESKRIYGSEGNGVDYFNYKIDDAIVSPKQENGYDCGVFACTTAEFLSRELPLTFSQNDMPVLRERMAYEISTKNLLS